MNKLLNILAILFSTIASGQADLVEFKKKCLVDIYYSTELEFNDRLSKIDLLNDTLEIKVERKDDCIYEEASGEFINENDTLKLYYSLRETDPEITFTSMCDCEFEFTYIIRGITEIPTTILVNDTQFIYEPDRFKRYEVSYEILDGDTLNFVDRFGLRQARWIMFDEDTVDWRGENEFVRLVHDYIYINNKIYYGSRMVYDSDYKLHSILRFNKDSTRDAYLYDKEGKMVKHDFMK